MAFTDTQKLKIRFYLGFPNIYVDCNQLLESAIRLAEANPAMQTETEEILAKLADIDDRLTNIALDVAGISSAGAGDPEFYEGGTQRELRSMGRMFCGRLGILYGCVGVNDPYSNNGYTSGYGWGSAAYQYSIPNGL
jgi:hypothetical protein